VRRFRARRAPRLRRRDFEALRLFFADLLRRRLAEREEAELDTTLGAEVEGALWATPAEEDGARGVRARRRRAFRLVLPRRALRLDDLDAARRRRALRRGAGDGEAAGAGAFGTDERLLRRGVDRDRELRLRLVERDRELRERLERDREVDADALGALGVELRRRRREEERRRLRDRLGCFTLRERGAGEADISRFLLAFRFARNSSFSFW